MGLIAKFAWIALPALAGFGVLSQVFSQGAGTNPGGKARELKAEASSSKIKLNKNGLPWPENPTPATVLKDYSWEQEFKQPGSAKNLPYYGKVTPAEVVDHINQVWNATKNVKHVPGQTTAQTWKRIQEKVDPVIKSLGYKPTEAHKQIMYDAGIATFIATNMTYGEPDQSIPELHRSQILSYFVNNEKPGIKFANAILRQQQLRGVCADISALDMALKHEAGILAVYNNVYSRRESLNAVPKDPSLINHGIVITLYPNKQGTSINPTRRMDAPLDNFSRLLNDPTSYALSNEQKQNLSEIKVFPKMPHFAVGGKGDDIFRVFFGGRFASFANHIDGSDNSKVLDFGKNGRYTFDKPLDRSFQQLFDDIHKFEDAWKSSK
jgi:hypothetical protein